MIGFYSMLIIVVFFSVILSSSRYFYMMELRAFSKKVMKNLQVDIINLDFSFGQMVYFISLPSNLPHIKHAKKEDIVVELEYNSYFFPKIRGIKVLVEGEENTEVLAYLPISDFRLPSLDRILEEGRINEEEYLKMSMYKLMHPETVKEIAEETYKQIQVGRLV
ncbi:hypothetical protein [Bacillus suaedaesalsae]|uniref:DUF4230 domain-containing protein n=1 Tax=Bacillus suaedaesalsae TaxID=2810349 RepID=A0ABS2DEJ1_9BACI|nr:hypothetical protein [Bacillus suaedaesalsae]MBM6616883.1 hypothetical protein [Bacillus suaedaesalsae]